MNICEESITFSATKNLLKIKLEKAEAEPIRFEILPYTYEIARKAAEIDAKTSSRRHKY